MILQNGSCFVHYLRVHRKPSQLSRLYVMEFDKGETDKVAKSMLFTYMVYVKAESAMGYVLTLYHRKKAVNLGTAHPGNSTFIFEILTRARQVWSQKFPQSVSAVNAANCYSLLCIRVCCIYLLHFEV